MIGLILALALNAAGLWVAQDLFDGVDIHGTKAYVIAAVVLAVVNTVLKPVLKLLTLPFILLTLGLFLLVINVVMVWITAKITPDFSVDGAGAYIGTVIVLWLVNWAGHALADRLR
jgi:putative membrane protein